MTTLVERVSVRAAGMQPGPSAVHAVAWTASRFGWLLYFIAATLWRILAVLLAGAGKAAFFVTAAVLTGWEDAADSARRRQAVSGGDGEVR